MSVQEVKAAQLEAAHTLCGILTQQGILHAFIGGFGIGLLGSTRPTEDIDVMIDVCDSREIINRIRPLLQEQDSRFSVEGLKLYFTSGAHQHVRVPTETLAVGTLGLPSRIIALSFKTRIQPSSNPRYMAKANVNFAEDLPLLQPSILILTKIKRWATLSESTRPRSIMKAQADLEDIRYLLHWLAQHKENIDFARYDAARPERLFDAVRQLVHIGKRDGRASLLELLFSVLMEEDLAKIKDA